MLALVVFAGLQCSREKKSDAAPKRETSAEQKPQSTPASSGPADSSVAVATAPRESDRWHARPLESIPARVPPIEKSEWLRKHFAWYIPAQDAGPENWSAVEKDIHPGACGSCHAQQFKDWSQSLHHKAMGPSVLGQLLDMELDAPLLSITCQRCHAPLAEQVPYLEKGKKNPDFEEGFREQGLVCAACHVRNHTHFGPPPRHPMAENGPHGGFIVKTEYESPAFCASCHDFAPGGGVHGKLVQETAEEWRRTPFAEEGKTCQSCHMPDRRHLWKGIHDPDMVRSAVSIQAQCDPPAKAGDSLQAKLEVTNVGAGHRFPTYTEPQVTLILEQLDKAGKPLPGPRVEGAIARKVTEEMDRELFDTRLLPGETFSLSYPRTLDAKAKTLLARVEVWPDESYRLYFKKMLETPALRPEMASVVENVEKALKTDTDSRYVLWEKKISLK
jgi:hypothetical protein